MPGGTAYYFSKALRNLHLDYVLVTAVAESEHYIVEDLRKEGINIISLPSEKTVYFENIYGENQDKRIQRVLALADPFTVQNMPATEASIFHFGPLLYQDFSKDLFIHLASQGMLSLDIQGLLRYAKNLQVFYQDWDDKEEILPYIDILKADDFELEVLTGKSDVKDGAKYLADKGVKEIVITLASRGSIIYTQGSFHDIPAIKPRITVDTTGCGDTYMGGYLYQKLKGADAVTCGIYGAAMASIKIQSFGPFNGSVADIEDVIKIEF